MNKNYFRLFILTLITLPLTAYLLCDTFNAGNVVATLTTLVSLALIIITFVFTVDKTLHGSIAEWEAVPLLPVFSTFKSWLIILFIISLVPVKQPANLWNQSITSYNNYTQKTQQKKGYYDKMYKSYAQQKEISFINQEQFTKIASIIMDNKKDGQALAWKWISEQKVIPFEEFSSFWRDLSSFIATQREGYYALETECQQLANINNTLLSTFPNNVYNWVLNRPLVKYSYGFTSDKTEEVFTTGKENL